MEGREARQDHFGRQIDAARLTLMTLEERSARSPDLAEALEELASALEELSVAAEELRQQNDDLAAARQIVEAERQRYQDLFEFAPDGYLVTSISGVIQEANRAASTLLGVPQGFLVGKPLAVFIPEEEHATFYAHLAEAQRANLWSWQTRLQAREGASLPVAVTVGLVRGVGDRLMGMRWLLRDVTELVRAQEVTAWLATFPELDPHPVVELDAEGHVDYFNRSAKSLFPDLSTCGPEHSWLSGLETVGGMLRKAGSGSTVRELAIGERWYQQTLHAVEAGRRLRIYGLDITERRRTEEELRRHREHLEQLVDERTTQLRESVAEVQRLNAELEERVRERTAQLEVANKELEAFSYSISHDLRAPLRAISGFARILGEEHASSVPDEAKRYVRTIEDNAQRMGQLIDDLLSFSRSIRQPLMRRAVSMIDLVRQVLADLRAEQEGRPVRIDVGDLPEVQGDPSLLRQVYTNLLSNAFKFTRGREPAIIEAGFRQEGAEGVYFVRDNGVGFDMRYADKLFGVFRRLHSAEEYEGTGVGLAIVQRIVARHGGRIWAEAELGKGAAFYFTLG